MSRHPAYGLMLALAGALILTPDALLMRLSGMDGLQMMGWRGSLMGSVMIALWLVLARGRVCGDLAGLFSGAGVVVVLVQAFNGAFFSLGIANAPVTVVLLGVATVPVFSAIFTRVLMREPTSRATWITIAVVMVGIGLAILGKTDAEATLDASNVIGGLFGLGVAACLALSFVVIRKNGAVPILPAVGSGAFLCGMVGLAATGPSAMLDGNVAAIVLTGAVILPISFFLLSLASRHTAAANVSLLLLLETVLAPIWVWLGTSEAPTPLMLAGGALVVGSLAVYLLRLRKSARAI